jgi:dUTP pyrophosphatase
MELPVKLLAPTAVVPSRAKPNDAGLDLCSAYDYVVQPRATQVVKTEVAVAIPVGYYGRVAPRSSVSLKGILVGAGVADSGYRDGIGVVLHNISDAPYVVTPGQKVAQLIITKINDDAKVVVVKDLPPSVRGTSGFGSSGTHAAVAAAGSIVNLPAAAAAAKKSPPGTTFPSTWTPEMREAALDAQERAEMLKMVATGRTPK